MTPRHIINGKEYGICKGCYNLAILIPHCEICIDCYYNRKEIISFNFADKIIKQMGLNRLKRRKKNAKP